MGWVDNLKGYTVGLDTAPLIYFTEENGAYSKLLDPFFQALGRGEFNVVTSVMTLLETLVKPIKEGDLKLAQQYRDFLFTSENVTVHDISPTIAEEAARLRAFYNVRTPDSIQLATAITAKAHYFLTNDIVLHKSLPGLSIVVLDDLKHES